MSVKMEIERKFLVEMPNLKFLNVIRQIDILQTYLKSDSDGTQRRVRKIIENNEEKFIYTEKIFYSPISRKETEYSISRNKYNELLTKIRTDCVPISKKRICFDYENQLFELDIYPFSDKLAILEIEFKELGQEIFFPSYIKVIKEVTGVEAYSNSALGKAGAFPVEEIWFRE